MSEPVHDITRAERAQDICLNIAINSGAFTAIDIASLALGVTTDKLTFGAAATAITILAVAATHVLKNANRPTQSKVAANVRRFDRG